MGKWEFYLWIYAGMFLVLVGMAFIGIIKYGYHPLASVYVAAHVALLIANVVLFHICICLLVYIWKKKRHIREEAIQKAEKEIGEKKEAMKKYTTEEMQKIQNLMEEIQKREAILAEREKKIETYTRLLKNYEEKLQRTNELISDLKRICFVDDRSIEERFQWMKNKIYRYGR